MHHIYLIDMCYFKLIKIPKIASNLMLVTVTQSLVNFIVIVLYQCICTDKHHCVCGKASYVIYSIYNILCI